MKTRPNRYQHPCTRDALYDAGVCGDISEALDKFAQYLQGVADTMPNPDQMRLYVKFVDALKYIVMEANTADATATEVRLSESIEKIEAAVNAALESLPPEWEDKRGLSIDGLTITNLVKLKQSFSFWSRPPGIEEKESADDAAKE